MHNPESIRQYCLAKAHVSEGLPFDESTLVFYVAEKIFLLFPLESEELNINLKCDPEKAVELRAEYEQIIPGFHMNKTHWNTVYVDGLSGKLIMELIDHSYNMVIAGFSGKKRKLLGLE